MPNILFWRLGNCITQIFPSFRAENRLKDSNFTQQSGPKMWSSRGKTSRLLAMRPAQFRRVPRLAEVASHLTIYQRSANWMLHKGDRPFTKFEKFLARHVPGFLRLNRLGWFSLGEFFLYPVIQGKKWRSKIAAWTAMRDMKKHIKDPELRENLIPDYPIGAKRILIADNYYETLARDNVSVKFKGVKEVNAKSIETPDGEKNQHDIIVYATGFKTDPFYQKLSIKGEGGKSLEDHWAGGAKAYHGVMTAGFPNLFMLYGPNTNTGHTSIIFKLENQAGYVLKLIERAGDSKISVKAQAEKHFDDEMQERLNETAWAKVETSWYKQNGRIANNWPGSGLEYKRRMKTPIWEDFEIG